jgi:hypothetical protein
VIPLTDERLRQLAYDDMVCTNANEQAMAAELLSARARVAELEAALDAKILQHAETLGMLEEAYAEIERMRVALEAAQRPPDGYIAIGKKSEADGSIKYRHPSLIVWPDRRRCELERGKFEVDDEREPEFLRREYIVAEVREAQS